MYNTRVLTCFPRTNRRSSAYPASSSQISARSAPRCSGLRSRARRMSARMRPGFITSACESARWLRLRRSLGAGGRMKGHRVAVTGMGVVTPLGSERRRVRRCADRRDVPEFARFRSSTRARSRRESPAKRSFRRTRRSAIGKSRSRSKRRAKQCARRRRRRRAGRSRVEATSSASASASSSSAWDAPRGDLAERQPGFVLPEGLEARLSFMQTPSDLSVHIIAAGSIPSPRRPWST